MAHRYLIGVGNETMTDDGVGPRVARAVSEQATALGFETVVAGHDMVGILAYFEETTDRILFVDCVRMGKAPGEWACFSPEDVEGRRRLDRLTTHEGDVLQMVELARRLGCPIPPITILGIEPASTGPGLEISPTLQTRLDEYAAAALTTMAR